MVAPSRHGIKLVDAATAKAHCPPDVGPTRSRRGGQDGGAGRTTGDTAEAGAPGEKGLKGGALGFVSGVVIGVASTAPGYSLAAVLGLVAVAVGYQAPAVLLLAFIPMLFIASSYYYMNRADPDCGTTFSWVTKAMGPYWGWMGGWGIIVADIIVMANLAEIAAIYSLQPVRRSTDPNSWVVLGLGVAWIAVMTIITWIGIELSARTQVLLLGAELVTLALFAVIALVPGLHAAMWADSVQPSLEWFNPFLIPDATALTAGLILAIFIYWGWDSTVTVNEESEDSTEGPGKAAIVSTLILLGIYLLVSTAAQAVHGIEFLTLDENTGDVLGALASDVHGQSARQAADHRRADLGGRLHPDHHPADRADAAVDGRQEGGPVVLGEDQSALPDAGAGDAWMGALSIVWYVGLKLVSENILYDAIAALGLMIAFYYGLTGFACAIYYRYELMKSVKNFLFIGVLPVIGGVDPDVRVGQVRSSTWPIRRTPSPATRGSASGRPSSSASGMMLFGVVLMLLQRMREPEFFKRKARGRGSPRRDPWRLVRQRGRRLRWLARSSWGSTDPAGPRQPWSRRSRWRRPSGPG